MKKLKISLLAKILLLCVGLVLLSSLLMRYFAFRTAKITIEDTMGQTSMEIVRSVVKTIDTDKFDELLTAEDMENEYYTELREKLNDIRSTTGLKYLYTMRRTETGDYIYVVDGVPFDDEEASLLGDIETDISDLVVACFQGTEDYEFYESDIWGPLISGYIPIKNNAGEIIGIIGADFEADFMVAKLKEANTNMFIIMGIILLFSVIIAVTISILMIRSLKQLKNKISQIQDGNLTIDVFDDRGDEIGSLSRSFQGMLKHMSQMIRNIRNHSMEVLTEVDALKANVEISNQSTEEIIRIVTEISTGASEQLDSVTMVANTMERVFNEIETITNNINVVNKDSDLAMDDMVAAKDILNGSVKQINIVNDTVETTSTLMKNLEDKFKEVLSFSSIVTSIASRTNLLALNAAIEAASVGEHGKGFAVVADEIKKLAEQSSDASKRIQELVHIVQEEINHSAHAIENGVVQAKNGVEVMSEVVLYLDKVSSSNEKIDLRIKDVTKAISNIENDSKNVLDKTIKLAEISKELSDETKETVAETEEQLAVIEGIKKNITFVKDKMEQLGGTVNQFKIH